MNKLEAPKSEANDSKNPGTRASRKVTFGAHSRFAVFAVHTRGDAVQWFVADGEAKDDVADGPAIVRQEDSFAAAISGLAD